MLPEPDLRGGKPGICPERQNMRGGKIDLFLSFNLAVSHPPPKLVVKGSSYIDKISPRQGKIAQGKRDPYAAVRRNRSMTMKVESSEECCGVSSRLKCGGCYVTFPAAARAARSPRAVGFPVRDFSAESSDVRLLQSLYTKSSKTSSSPSVNRDTVTVDDLRRTADFDSGDSGYRGLRRRSVPARDPRPLSGISYVRLKLGSRTENCQGSLVQRGYLPIVLQTLRIRGFMLHHDSASSHTSAVTGNFLKECNIVVLEHPPYSPDLETCDLAVRSAPNTQAPQRLRLARAATRFHHVSYRWNLITSATFGRKRTSEVTETARFAAAEDVL
ncbi:hypothetical protein EVAR_35233_1 [Eumeta japonica]|uniref:Mariner Mos1 transposase n=1 Tax=Eumeta variegata TaxID=151549 RepID=A0A4C1VDH2_EUMVA|nr:hypothetical protein EVAR_35233_1 [Eumeta japonica]